ncbi:hypothetical protein FCH28_37515 [Streptomyces piniterrae]|uniref:Uncharacterized protein n=1 Tax=Streptomyces piniterrae TaxID=2571125 RepID=A0A4V5MHE8_9ACTN|nr:hypothetical protein [Streptomyces piniterrae]TJZ41188.1 hypothetical protein FCH28_37515 [Streptomyces piniterrae]
MNRERNIPPSTSMLGNSAHQPTLVPSVGPPQVGARNQGDQKPDAKSTRSTTPRRAPRRRGRPRGPEREMLSVRILAENDRKLTAAVEATGLNPQSIVDQALEAYFKRLKIQDPDAA